MQYPELRVNVFQGFREIGNAVLFALQIETLLVSKCRIPKVIKRKDSKLHIVPQIFGGKEGMNMW